jgi:hypothetical protein
MYDSGTISTYTSVADFLGGALKAAQSANYAGVVLLIARTASDRQLLQQMYDNNVSIDDVTAEHLLVLTPNPTFPYPQASDSLLREASPETLPEDYESEFVDYGAHEELSAGSIAVVGRPTESWNENFWDTNVKRTVRPIMKASRYEDIVTQSATETRKFFGLPESLVPCLVLLSLREKAAWIMALTKDVDIYLILKAIVYQLETPPTSGGAPQPTTERPEGGSLSAAVIRAVKTWSFVEQTSPSHIPNFDDWSVRTLLFDDRPLDTDPSRA